MPASKVRESQPLVNWRRSFDNTRSYCRAEHEFHELSELMAISATREQLPEKLQESSRTCLDDDTRILELDGIRGLAIAMVLFRHFFPHHWWTANAWSRGLYILSDHGVDVFFVLSGFLIGGILLRPGLSLRSFYLRRAFRILPLYWLLLLSFLVVPFVDVPLEFGVIKNYTSEVSVPFWSYAVFLQNNVVSWRQHWGADWLVVTWSLAIEEQFYLIAPWIVGRVSKRQLITLCITTIILCPLIRWGYVEHANNLHAAYSLLICRADALCAGVLLAALVGKGILPKWIGEHAGWITLSGLTLVTLGLSKAMFLHPLTFVWSPSLKLLSAALLVAYVVTHRRTVSASIFRWRPLVMLGGISFFVYLFHFPILHVIRAGAINLGFQAEALCVAATILVTLAAASISLNRFERPLMNFGRALARSSFSSPTKT